MDPSSVPNRFPKHLPQLKQHLSPSRAPFSDALQTPFVSPATAFSSASSPSPRHHSSYDYFQWEEFANRQESQTQSTDLTTTAPACAIGDVHNPVHSSVPQSECYAISHGLQSFLGSLISTRRAQEGRMPTKRRMRPVTQTPCTCNSLSLSSACLTSSTSYAQSSMPLEYHDENDNLSSSSNNSSLSEDDDSDHATVPSRPLPAYRSKSVPVSNFLSLQGNTDDITADHASIGVDIQGIPWHTRGLTREDYRATVLRERNQHALPQTGGGLRDLVKEPKKDARFFDFFQNTRKVNSSIFHFQLRNLAWATSKHDVFVMHAGVIVHWDASARRKSPVLDLSVSNHSARNSIGTVVQVSTMIAKDDLVIAGGFYGDIVAKNVKTGTIIYNQRITYEENAITNAIEVNNDTVMTSNNDCYVRTFDLQTFQRKSAFRFQQPVNHATRKPDDKMVAVAGDDKPVVIIDGDTGERIAQLHGHEDYSFATGWHPSGRLLATGSQDHTCRIWDVRNMSQCITVLGARMQPFRSLRFSSCGQLLVVAEARDYVHVFDVNRGEFDSCQEIDFFGEIAGIALSPCADALYIALCEVPFYLRDPPLSSLLEYERRIPSLADPIL